jgi:polar amino acid transport system substrate-binding protein
MIAFDRSRTSVPFRWMKSLGLALTATALLAGCTPPSSETTEGPARIRVEKVPAAAALIPAGHQFAKPGVLTVALTVGQLPLADYTADGESVIGSEPDIAQLIADSLGLKLDLVSVAWPDWPLGLESGKYDAVISNVTVTEERKAKFDFSTYRDDQLGIYARADTHIPPILGARDVAGLRVTVGASTNQAQILDRWNAENIAAGLAPVQIQNYDDTALSRLAILSGRADISFEPNSTLAYQARDGKTKKLGSFSGGWPLTAQIAVATRKGSGLAEAVTAALNAQIASGAYERVLERWNLESEAIPQAQTNPPGLPRP